MKIWVGVQEAADPWNYMQSGECNGRADAQPSFEPSAQSARGGFCLIGFREGAARPLVEGLPSFGWVKLAR